MGAWSSGGSRSAAGQCGAASWKGGRRCRVPQQRSGLLLLTPRGGVARGGQRRLVAGRSGSQRGHGFQGGSRPDDPQFRRQRRPAGLVTGTHQPWPPGFHCWHLVRPRREGIISDVVVIAVGLLLD